MKRRAFSLIELLATIAVIATLTGILLPSLKTARDAGRGVRCLAQVRQLQLSNDLYADDHREHFAPGAADFIRNMTRWHGVRTSIAEAFRPDGAPLAEYSDVPGLVARTCPSFRPPEEGLGFERGSGAYGYNNAYVGTHGSFDERGTWQIVTDLEGTPRQHFDAPGEVLAFGDAAFPDRWAADRVIEYAFAEPRFNPSLPANEAEGRRMDPSLHFRHTQGTANAVFLDGHAEARALAFTWSSGFYTPDARKVSIGWFETPDDNTGFAPRHRARDGSANGARDAR